jgi:hypothetical protein
MLSESQLQEGPNTRIHKPNNKHTQYKRDLGDQRPPLSWRAKKWVIGIHPVHKKTNILDLPNRSVFNVAPYVALFKLRRVDRHRPSEHRQRQKEPHMTEADHPSPPVRWKAILYATAMGFLLLFALLIVSMAFAPATYNRLAADDFCYPKGGDIGLWQLQIDWWRNWSGRHFATLLITIVPNLSRESGSLALYSMISFGLVLVSFFLCARQLRLSVFASCVLGMLCFGTLFLATPNQAESWYWLAGSASYLWPLLLTNGCLYLGLRKQHTQRTYLAGGLLACWATAGNETYGLLFCLVLWGMALATIWSLYRQTSDETLFVRCQRHSSLRYLILLGCTSGLSFLLMYLSPGNAVRQSRLPSQHSLLSMWPEVLSSGPTTLLSIGETHWRLFAILMVLSFCLTRSTPLFASRTWKQMAMHLAGSAVLLVGLSVLFMFPSYYVSGTPQPMRSVITMVYMLVIASILLGLFLRDSLPKRLPTTEWLAIAACLLALQSLHSYQHLNWNAVEGRIQQARRYANAYDTWYQTLRKQRGAKVLRYRDLPGAGVLYATRFQTDPAHWSNKCIATFFQAKQAHLRTK